MDNKETEIIKEDRRTFLSLLPIGVLGLVAASITQSAKHSLDPIAEEAATANWTTLDALNEFAGQEPIEQTVAVTCRSGWQKTVENKTVFVLPKHNNKVLSSVCPHEGCPIVWEGDSGKFLCPCHDSYFSDSGERLTGPASIDLTEYETRVEDGKLQIKV
jgi:Rieske Fe-S protein